MAVRALVVGSFVVDLAFQVPTRPRPGEVVVATEHGTYRGGKGYNQAVALARLGAEVTMIGAVGGDAYGDDFLDSLEREGIDASRVVQLRGSATAVAVPLITPDGAAAFVQSPGANRQLSVAHCADLPDAELLLLQGEVLPSTSAHAGRVMRRRGAQVLLRPSPVDEVTEELRDLATVVVAGPVETASLLGDVDLSDDEGAVAAAQGLARDGQLGVLMLRTLHAAYAGPQGSGTVAPPPVQAVDHTGSTDSFCAALAMALAEGSAHPEAVRFACAAAALTSTVSGAEPSLPRRADVEALLAGEAA